MEDRKPRRSNIKYLHRVRCADSTREVRPSQPSFDILRDLPRRAPQSIFLGRHSRYERSVDMRVSRWIVSAMFTFSICSSCQLFSQEPSSKRPVKTGAKEAAKPKTGAPLDSVMEALYAAHTFEQTAVAPDGKKVAWVETLLGRDGAHDGHTAIYVADRESGGAPKRVTAAALKVAA